jgi:broad specificity phosphatase PhoE
MQFPITRLMLVRHGETEANVAGRMQGRGNDPLTERGQQQVRAIAERLKQEAPHIAAIYSSPLLRARLTADQIAATLGVSLSLRDGLQEMHLGELEGVSAAELSAAVPVTPDERYPNGESAREFVERIMGTLHGLVAAHSGEALVAVSHGGVISTALSIWSVGHGGAWRDYAPTNCALSIIEFSVGPTIVALNDCVHL